MGPAPVGCLPDRGDARPRAPAALRTRSAGRHGLGGERPAAPARTDAARYPAVVLTVATGVDRLGTEGAFTVLARALELERTGREVVHLEIGEPDFATPEHVVEAAVQALRAGQTHYTPTLGLGELRAAAAAYLGAGRGVSIGPERVIIANGAKPIVLFTILACANAGDEVIYPDPGFPIYESVISWAGAVPVALPLREERGFSFDPEELRSALTPRTRLVILNSPHNPTGSVIPHADLLAAAEMLAETDAWILSDEVYARIVYEQDCPSLGSLPGMLDRTVIVDSCSKTFAMTGWRCGFASVPPPLIVPMERLLVNSTSCVPAFVQLGAVAALTGPMDAVDDMVSEFSLRRKLLIDGLNALPGVSCAAPSGAFYAFPNVSGTGFSGEDLATRLLETAGVATVPGSAFGREASAHLRLSYANSRENLGLALQRIGALLEHAV